LETGVRFPAEAIRRGKRWC